MNSLCNNISNFFIFYRQRHNKNRCNKHRKYKRLIREKYIRWINEQCRQLFASPNLEHKLLSMRDKDLKISHWVPYLCHQESISESEKLLHTWSDTNKSAHIYIKESDPFTFHRNPVINSTDSIRGKKGYSQGIHIWVIVWPQSMRGTDAVIGVATDKSILQHNGYTPLVGFDNESWGWDIVRCRKVHGKSLGYPINDEKYPEANKLHLCREGIPDTIYVILDMYRGTLAFMTTKVFLGVAHRDLVGKTLYPTVSSVWGHSEVSLKYINGITTSPPSLTSLSRYKYKKLLKYHCIFNKTFTRQMVNVAPTGIDPSTNYIEAVCKQNIPRTLKRELLKCDSMTVDFF